MTTFNGAINSVVVGLSRAHLSSLISIPLLVKVIVLEEIFVIVSRVVILAVQIFESVRVRFTSCSCLPKRVRLGIGLVTSSQQSVVLNSITTIFLIFNVLSIIGMSWMSSVSTITILSYLLGMVYTGWKSTEWTWRWADLWNNLGFSLCTAPSVCCAICLLHSRNFRW